MVINKFYLGLLVALTRKEKNKQKNVGAIKDQSDQLIQENKLCSISQYGHLIMLCVSAINYCLKTQSSHLLQIPYCRVVFWVVLLPPPQQSNKCGIKAVSVWLWAFWRWKLTPVFQGAVSGSCTPVRKRNLAANLSRTKYNVSPPASLCHYAHKVSTAIFSVKNAETIQKSQGEICHGQLVTFD